MARGAVPQFFAFLGGTSCRASINRVLALPASFRYTPLEIPDLPVESRLRRINPSGMGEISAVETLTDPSFYCNHCDKWVDGIPDASKPAVSGFKQVLCDDCRNPIYYRAPRFWRKLQRLAYRYFRSSRRAC
jgi:hypothetical protein